MREIRLHARFGQPLGELVKKIVDYALANGYHVQVFNTFAAVRPGAPTFGVVRIDEEEIRERSAPEVKPDIVIVLDNSLFAAGNVLKGLKSPGTVLALGVDKGILGETKDLEFIQLDSYFQEDPSDVGLNLIKALQDLEIIR